MDWHSEVGWLECGRLPQTDRSLAAGVIISPAGLPRTPLISNYDDIRLFGVKVIGGREGTAVNKGESSPA